MPDASLRRATYTYSPHHLASKQSSIPKIPKAVFLFLIILLPSLSVVATLFLLRWPQFLMYYAGFLYVPLVCVVLAYVSFVVFIWQLWKALRPDSYIPSYVLLTSMLPGVNVLILPLFIKGFALSYNTLIDTKELDVDLVNQGPFTLFTYLTWAAVFVFATSLWITPRAFEVLIPLLIMLLGILLPTIIWKGSDAVNRLPSANPQQNLWHHHLSGWIIAMTIALGFLGTTYLMGAYQDYRVLTGLSDLRNYGNYQQHTTASLLYQPTWQQQHKDPDHNIALPYHIHTVRVTEDGFYGIALSSDVRFIARFMHYISRQVRESLSLTHTFAIQGYLYEQSFDPSQPFQNFIASSYAKPKGDQARLLTQLSADTEYILVVTGTEPLDSHAGTYTVRIHGPSTIALDSPMPLVRAR